MELAALAVALSAAIVALVLTPLVRRVALKLNFVDKPGERKIHDREIAYGGGIAVALALGLTACQCGTQVQTKVYVCSTNDDAMYRFRIAVHEALTAPAGA